MCWTLDRKVAFHLNYLSWLEMYPIRSPKSIWRLQNVLNFGYSLICCGCGQDTALIWSWCGSCLNWEEKTSWFHSEWFKTQNPSLVFQYTHTLSLSLSLLDTHIHFNLIPTHQLILISWSWGWWILLHLCLYFEGVCMHVGDNWVSVFTFYLSNTCVFEN